MTTAIFTPPAADTFEAAATREAPAVADVTQALEIAVARCAVDPDRDALEERAVLKAIRLLDKHLTDTFGPDSVRAAFRQALYALGDLRETRTPFLLSDNVTVLWLDLYPHPDFESGRAAHVYLDPERATAKARTRWGRVAPKPAKAVPVAPVAPLVALPAKTPRPSKRMEATS